MQQLLVQDPFAAGFSHTCNTWSAFVAFLSNGKDPDGKLVYGVQGIVKMQQTVIWRADGVCEGFQ